MDSKGGRKISAFITTYTQKPGDDGDDGPDLSRIDSMQGGDGRGEIDCRRPDSTMEEEEMETAVPPSVRKRKMEDEPMEDQLEEEEQEVIRACVIEGSKHADPPRCKKVTIWNRGTNYLKARFFFEKRLYYIDKCIWLFRITSQSKTVQGI